MAKIVPPGASVNLGLGEESSFDRLIKLLEVGSGVMGQVDAAHKRQEANNISALEVADQLLGRASSPRDVQFIKNSLESTFDDNFVSNNPKYNLLGSYVQDTVTRKQQDFVDFETDAKSLMSKLYSTNNQFGMDIYEIGKDPEKLKKHIDDMGGNTGYAPGALAERSNVVLPLIERFKTLYKGKNPNYKISYEVDGQQGEMTVGNFMRDVRKYEDLIEATVYGALSEATESGFISIPEATRLGKITGEEGHGAEEFFNYAKGMRDNYRQLYDGSSKEFNTVLNSVAKLLDDSGENWQAMWSAEELENNPHAKYAISQIVGSEGFASTYEGQTSNPIMSELSVEQRLLQMSTDIQNNLLTKDDIKTMLTGLGMNASDKRTMAMEGLRAWGGADYFEYITPPTARADDLTTGAPVTPSGADEEEVIDYGTGVSEEAVEPLVYDQPLTDKPTDERLAAIETKLAPVREAAEAAESAEIVKQQFSQRDRNNQPFFDKYADAIPYEVNKDKIPVRHNNPLSLRFASQDGATESGSGKTDENAGFADFNSINDGWMAGYKRIGELSDANHTIESFTEVWDSENKENYTQLLQKILKKPKDTLIKDMDMQEFATAVARVEGYLGPDGQAPGYASLMMDKEKWKVKTDDEIEKDFKPELRTYMWDGKENSAIAQEWDRMSDAEKQYLADNHESIKDVDDLHGLYELTDGNIDSLPKIPDDVVMEGRGALSQDTPVSFSETEGVKVDEEGWLDIESSSATWDDWRKKAVVGGGAAYAASKVPIVKRTVSNAVNYVKSVTGAGDEVIAKILKDKNFKTHVDKISSLKSTLDKTGKAAGRTTKSTFFRKASQDYVRAITSAVNELAEKYPELNKKQLNRLLKNTNKWNLWKIKAGVGTVMRQSYRTTGDLVKIAGATKLKIAPFEVALLAWNVGDAAGLDNYYKAPIAAISFEASRQIFNRIANKGGLLKAFASPELQSRIGKKLVEKFPKIAKKLGAKAVVKTGLSGILSGSGLGTAVGVALAADLAKDVYDAIMHEAPEILHYLDAYSKGEYDESPDTEK